MPRINLLSSTSSISSGDLFAVFVQSVGDVRKVPLSQLVTYLEPLLSTTGKQEFTKQYYAPNTTGFSVQITDNDDNIWLILTPTTGLAAGTIILPALGNVADKQEILVNSTQQVNALTVNGNGASVNGAPTSLGADDFFKLKYDNVTQSWYLVG